MRLLSRLFHRPTTDERLVAIRQAEQRLCDAQTTARRHIENGDITAQDFRAVGDAYDAYLKARTSRT